MRMAVWSLDSLRGLKIQPCCKMRCGFADAAQIWRCCGYGVGQHHNGNSYKWNFIGTQPLPLAYVLSMSAFVLEWQNWVVATEAIWPGLLKYFLKKSLATPALERFNEILSGVPIMAQRKQIQLRTMRFRVQSLASLSGLKIWRCRELWCRSRTWLRSRIAVAVV